MHIRQQLQRVGKRLAFQDLKTEKSRRVLMLPEVCLNALGAHRTRQLEERLKAGADWIETGLVFTTDARRGNGRKVGAGLHPRNVLRTLHHLLDSANPKLPRIRFHDLRHSAALLLIAAGVELVDDAPSDTPNSASLPTFTPTCRSKRQRKPRQMDAVLDRS